MGQTAMAPGNGVVNRAVGAFRDLNQTGPGWLYYGINAADRGLGYNGSYFTLGGFIPYAEDDMGGFWAADLRSHLSEYGGFFSNVGLVRKQFLGGSLFGVGVYWDYDGDLNQYPTNGALGTGQFGQFGHTYQQVGVSGEWLTDWGNFRSNGYMPIKTNGYTAGAPGTPFYQNFVMCQHGLDAALTGTDLEVGVYVPGLADWAGMISVGGYAYGNSLTKWQSGTLAGQDIVPWFGGVYTRLDMTFLNNWDFSLQANNDSYFDWTGFARLTYRMGGSRRRNVPDQMEQPMMRNEHVVRAHQTPIVATNGSNGNQPWRVIHVNNTAPAGGNGTAEAPFSTLAAGDAAATQAWDIVFVDRGDGTAAGYGSEFSFNAQNQYLVGNGGSFFLPTSTCGLKDIATDTSGLRPLLSNPAGNSVLIDGAVAGGATVANLQITGSKVGIAATGDLTGLPRAGESPYGPATQDTYAAGGTIVSNVAIAGNGTAASQTGINLASASGDIAFVDTAVANMTAGGFVSTAANGLTVDYQGSITNDVSNNGGVASPLIVIKDTVNGDPSVFNLAVGAAPGSSTIANEITDVGGGGISIENNGASTTINMANVTLTNNVSTAIEVFNDNATTSIVAAAGNGITKNTTGAAIDIQGGAPVFDYVGPITNTGPLPSYLLSVVDTGATSDVYLESPAGKPFNDIADGIQISNAAGDVTVIGAALSGNRGQGLLIDGGSSGTFKFRDVKITNAPLAGVSVLNSPSATVNFTNLNIALTADTATGILVNQVGSITANGLNTLTNTSTTNPAASFTDASAIDMTFTTVTSGVTNGTNAALEFLGTSGGAFTVSSNFNVGGAAGSATNDVTNAGGVTVTVPPP